MTKAHPAPEDAPQIPGIHEQVVVSRNLASTIGTVYDAWTELEQLRQWWGPRGFTISHASLDLRPEGLFHYCMVGPDGSETWGRLLFKEIMPMERLVYISSFSDAQGGIARAPFSETWPLETIGRVGCDEHGDDGTHIVVNSLPTNATQDEIETFRGAHDGMQKGINGMLDQLEYYLAGKPAV